VSTSQGIRDTSNKRFKQVPERGSMIGLKDNFHNHSTSFGSNSGAIKPNSSLTAFNSGGASQTEELEDQEVFLFV
jgi:hypothetical protein